MNILPRILDPTPQRSNKVARHRTNSPDQNRHITNLVSIPPVCQHLHSQSSPDAQHFLMYSPHLIPVHSRALLSHRVPSFRIPIPRSLNPLRILLSVGLVPPSIHRLLFILLRNQQSKASNLACRRVLGTRMVTAGKSLTVCELKIRNSAMLWRTSAGCSEKLIERGSGEDGPPSYGVGTHSNPPELGRTSSCRNHQLSRCS